MTAARDVGRQVLGILECALSPRRPDRYIKHVTARTRNPCPTFRRSRDCKWGGSRRCGVGPRPTPLASCQSCIISPGVDDGLTPVLEGLRRPAILVRMTLAVGRPVAARAGAGRCALEDVFDLVVPRPHRASTWSPRPWPDQGSRRSPVRGRPRSRSTPADTSGGTGYASGTMQPLQDPPRTRGSPTWVLELPRRLSCGKSAFQWASSGGCFLHSPRRRCRGSDKPRRARRSRQTSG